jgi:transmembrane sensor
LNRDALGRIIPERRAAAIFQFCPEDIVKTMADEPPAPSSDIRHQAAAWLARRHSGAWTLRDRTALEAWLNGSPEHRRAYRQVARLWGDLDAVKPGVAELTAAARRYRPQTSRARSRLEGAAWGLAALLLLTAGSAYWHWLGFETRYRTAKGETQEIVLADGSTLRLNTDSELTAAVGAARRRVDLLRGEALFDVAHDAARPFVVTAGAGRFEDLGTRFDVYVQDHRVAVNVLAGRVQIDSPANGETLAVLSAGDAAAYNAEGRLVPGYRSDVQSAASWLDGTLVFDDMPLPQVTAELSRYHPVSFELADRRLADIRISGRFQSGNLAVLLKTLEASFPIRITRPDAEHVRIERR